MFHRNRKSLLLSVFLAALMLLLFMFIEFLHYKQNGVDTTVYMPWAYLKQDGETCFLVGTFGKYDGGNELYYYLKNNKKVPVRITGNDPYHTIDVRFWQNDAVFLVYGSIDKEMTEYIGVDIINAEDWKMISPVQREVSLSKRYFASPWYIDTEDVANGSYQKCDETMRGIYYWEEEWLRYKWKDEYIILTPEYIDEKVQWYRMKNGVKYPIIVEGNVPGKTDAEESRFIARGTWSDDTSTFIVEEWRNTHPYSWKYSHLEY